MLHLELVLDLEIRVFREEETQVVGDLYVVNEKWTPLYQEAIFEKLLIRNASKCKVSDKISLEQNQEPILQICASEGHAVAEQVHRLELDPPLLEIALRLFGVEAL